jgi:hypothetical protein
VVFCGECGAAIPPGGDRAAHLPHAPGTAPAGKGGGRAPRGQTAQTLVGALPGVPVSPSAAPPPPVGKPTLAMPMVVTTGAGADRGSRPSDLGRHTVLGMPAVTSTDATAEREVKPGRDARPTRRELPGGGKKGRRGSMSGEEAPAAPAEVQHRAPISEESPQIEVSPISNAFHEKVVDVGTASGPRPQPPAQPAAVAHFTAAAAEPPAPARVGRARMDTTKLHEGMDDWGVAEPAPEAPKPAVSTGPQAAPNPGPPSGALEARAPSAPPPAALEARAPSAPPPAAPEKPRASPSVPPHDAEETKRLLEDLDAGFDSIVRPSAPVVWIGSGSPAGESLPDPVALPAEAEPTPSTVARAARHEADMAEVRELFAGIAVAYARPLRDFMIEVAWGEPTREWLDIALPAASALRRAAAAVELPELDAALEGYGTALELASGEGSIHREVREMLAGAYARLMEAMPGVFALEDERSRREPVIVRSLLLQVPGVHKVAIDKLYAAGVNGLSVFYAARPRELAEATGLDEALCAAVCERFQSYRREVAELSPGKDRARERSELEALTEELARHHEAHERAAAGWSADAVARRAQARKDRADTALRIDLLLARLGEVDLQRALAKLPFQQKIRELTRHLDEAKQKASRS